MKGESFRKEIVEVAHQDCQLCERIAALAVNNFREAKSQKTRSTSGDHWAEVRPNIPASSESSK